MTARLRSTGPHCAAACSSSDRLGFSVALNIAIRAAYGYDRVVDAEASTIVAMIAAPLFFLVGLGAFDYWFYWACRQADAARGPLEPRRHSPGRTTSASTPITR